MHNIPPSLAIFLLCVSTLLFIWAASGDLTEEDWPDPPDDDST